MGKLTAMESSRQVVLWELKGGSGLLQRAEKIGVMYDGNVLSLDWRGDYVSIYFVNSLICALTMSIFLCINYIFIRKNANTAFYILTT